MDPPSPPERTRQCLCRVEPRLTVAGTSILEPMTQVARIGATDSESLLYDVDMMSFGGRPVIGSSNVKASQAMAMTRRKEDDISSTLAS